MCGITGYVGDKKTVEVLLDGLKRLEYRGYDSSGVAVLKNDKIQVLKKRGKIAELEKEKTISEMVGTAGVAHTRWATHGEPNEVNAHPHTDCKNNIALVHNGIIENYHTLKTELIGEGHKFTSATDSEVIAHLIEKFLPRAQSRDDKGNFEEAVLKALKKIEGSFALAIIKKGEDKLIAARRGSPLIIGVGKNEMFVASDVPAILKYTKKVIYLDDDQIALITKDDIVIKNIDGKIFKPKINEIKWSLDQIEKGGFSHFMIKEIFEQPKAIENAMTGRIIKGKIQLETKTNPKKINRIVMVACGTAWHASLIAKNLIEKLVRIPVEVDYASEFRYRDPIIDKNDLLIAISQSGETADTLAAIREAKNYGAKTLGIVNAVGSSIAREVDEVIYLQAGPEIGVASTKAFTCQILCSLFLALSWQEKLGRKIDKKLIEEITALPSIIQNVLKLNNEIRKIAEKYYHAQSILYLGRGVNAIVALEGALKLKEISYIHAEGYPAGEMKHGPIALVDENLPVIFLAPDDKHLEKILSNMEEIRARKGQIIAVVNSTDEKLKKLTKDLIIVPKVCEELAGIINVIPLQIFSYHIADLKNIDMDKPRNLAKSVTVE